jgi:2-polyprenyl-3-methyl-5-hydroxy-6-metoxy-1,4-benzoquinol methylase
MSGDDPRSRYRSLGWRARLHVAVRWATCPFGPVEALLPDTGRVLDWGCGHGVLAILAASRQPGREVEGVDIDAEKIHLARRAAANGPEADRVHFGVIAPTDRPVGAWDAVVIDDVLYLLDPAAQEDLVRHAAGAVGPGGLLLVKDMAAEPGWKVVLTRMQEHLAVRFLRLTATGAGVHPSPRVDDLRRWMEDAGLAVEVHRLDRGYHCPHVAVTGRRW